MSLQSDLRPLQVAAREDTDDEQAARRRVELISLLVEMCLTSRPDAPNQLQTHLIDELDLEPYSTLLNTEAAALLEIVEEKARQWQTAQILLDKERADFYPVVYLQALEVSEKFFRTQFRTLCAAGRSQCEDRLLRKVETHYDKISGSVKNETRIAWFRTTLKRLCLDHQRRKRCESCKPYSVAILASHGFSDPVVDEVLSIERRGEAHDAALKFRRAVEDAVAIAPGCPKHLGKACPHLDLIQDDLWADREQLQKRYRDYFRSLPARDTRHARLSQDALEAQARRKGVTCFDWWFYIGARETDDRPHTGYAAATYTDPEDGHTETIAGSWPPVRKNKGSTPNEVALAQATVELIGPARHNLLGHIQMRNVNGIPALVKAEYTKAGAIHIYNATINNDDTAKGDWAYADLRQIVNVQRPDVVNWMNNPRHPLT